MNDMRKLIFLLILAGTVFAGTLSAGTAHVAHWDSTTTIRVAHLGTGTNVTCTIDFYLESGAWRDQGSYTYTTQFESHAFLPPTFGGGYAVINCAELAVATGYFDSGGRAFAVPINGGNPF